MKAAAVIEQYKNGRRDFRGESLRGGNFRGADLAGADFSGCDIRGTNFSRANLTGTKFAGAKAGLPKRWVVILLFVILLSILGSSVFILLASVIVIPMFDGTILLDQVGGNPKNAKTWGIIAGSILSISLSFISYIIFRRNIVTGAFILTISALLLFPIFLAVFMGGALAIAAIVMCTLSIGLALVIFSSKAVSYLLAFAISFSVFLLNYAGLTTESASIAKIFTIILYLLLGSISWLTLKQEHRDPWLRKIVIAFAAIGGTSFFQANLTEADFTGATLKSTNFNQAILNKTIFKQAIKLELARPGNTLLANPQIREFLIDSRTGSGKDFAQANLRGAYLEGANLQAANLRLANISEASLQYANLAGANLSEVNAVNADLRHATLTGACVENWNIDATTQLDEVDCQYIYLLNGQKERRPSSGEFQPGEFTKLFAEMFDTVDLIFRNGVDWKAFIAALKEVQVQNEDTPLQVQSIANKGDGVIVVKVHVPSDTDKEKIHQEFNQNYQLQLAAIEAQYKAQLTAKETEIAIYRQQSVDMMEITKTLANRPIHVEAKAMSNSNDSSQNITIRDINNSAVNFGEIIGDVTNTINQIAADASPENAQLKALLQELTQAIEIDSHLDEEEKAEAANQVKKIAQASQNPDDAGLQKKAQRAVNFLETIAKALEPASKLAQACQKALPIILKTLGF
ncbi:MAG: pentapeptide repeat-containing protein [Microcystis sp. M049S2]|nr:pentapeptide repeat-containing protein [Microcystis sp. M049S2]